MKGLAIGSMLSAGHTSTTAVPRHTTSPRLRVSSVNLKGSSGSGKGNDVIVNKSTFCSCTAMPSYYVLAHPNQWAITPKLVWGDR